MRKAFRADNHFRARRDLKSRKRVFGPGDIQNPVVVAALSGYLGPSRWKLEVQLLIFREIHVKFSNDRDRMVPSIQTLN